MINLAGYEIHWALGTSNFNLWQTTGSNVWHYRHDGLAVGSGLVSSYKVRGYYATETYTDFTNSAGINTSGFYKDPASIKNVNYSLSQNFPNPFNPSTKIEFSIANDEHVLLTLYNLLGQEVKSLLNDNLNAGHHTIELNSGALPSGIYFYKLSTAQYTNVKKMQLVK